jgi:hypothetical protein
VLFKKHGVRRKNDEAREKEGAILVTKVAVLFYLAALLLYIGQARGKIEAFLFEDGALLF